MATKYKYDVPFVLENVIHGIGSQICITTDSVSAEVLVGCSIGQAPSFSLPKNISESIKPKIIDALKGFSRDLKIDNIVLSATIRMQNEYSEFNPVDFFTTLCLAMTEMIKHHRQEPNILSQLVHKHAVNLVDNPSDSRIDCILFGGIRVSSENRVLLSSRIYHPKGLLVVVSKTQKQLTTLVGSRYSSLADFIIGCERSQLDRIKTALEYNPETIEIDIPGLLGTSAASSYYFGLCSNTSSAEKLQTYLSKSKDDDSCYICAISDEGIKRH